MILNNLFKDEFQCMFLKEENISLSKKFIRLDIDEKNLRDEKLLELLKFRDCTICFEKQGFGTLVFSFSVSDSPFENLQKKYKELPSYYFWASDTLGMFKILKDGKIQRKISSFGWIKDHTTSCEEQVLGKPCDYEIEKNFIYKMKGNERTIKLPKSELFSMFDYYVKIDRNKDIVYDNVKVYYNIDGVNLPYELGDFSKPEFMQALIHIGKDHENENTKPLVVFKNTNTIKHAFFRKVHNRNNLKNAKKLLNLSIFNKNSEKLLKTDLFFCPRGFYDSSFISSFARAIIEALRVGEKYETDYTQYQNAIISEGEFIPKTTSLFFFVVEFKGNKIFVKFYSIMKNGKEVPETLVAVLESFDKKEIIILFNKLLDYILDDNLADKLHF